MGGGLLVTKQYFLLEVLFIYATIIVSKIILTSRMVN